MREITLAWGLAALSGACAGCDSNSVEPGLECSFSGAKLGAAGHDAGGLPDSAAPLNEALRRSHCGGKPGPSYDQFFDNTKLATLKIRLESSNPSCQAGRHWLDALWSKWSHCPPHTDHYLSAEFEYASPDGIGDVSCQNVGIRLRGSWSRDAAVRLIQTRGLKLDMQALDTDATTHRRFADLNRINLLSIESDPTHMLQCVSYKLMRDFGIPAPRCNHLKVYVNNEYYGLLENVEQVNKGYVRRHFGTSTGSLYGASPGNGDCPNGIRDSAARLAYFGDSFANYVDQYELTSATASDAERNLIPMLKCGDANQTPDNATFRRCISEWVDVGEWLRLIAAESTMPELESWVGYNRNYYLYFNPDPLAPHGGRFYVWSWDLDTALGRNACLPASCDPFTAVDRYYGPMNTRAPLVLRLTAVFRAEYCSTLREFTAKIFKPSAVDEMAKVMESGISDEPTITASEWQAKVKTMRDYISSRSLAVQLQIDAACR